MATPQTPPGRPPAARARKAARSTPRSPSPSPPRRSAPAEPAERRSALRWVTAVTAVVVIAAAAWLQPRLHGQPWAIFVGTPARTSERDIRLNVKEFVPSYPAAPTDAGAVTPSHLLAHLRADESSVGVRATEETTPFVVRRPLAPPSLPTVAPGNGSGASHGVVILANGRDIDLLSKCYALITVIREVFRDPIPVAVFHLGRAESFSPAAIGAFAALGNVTVADLGAATGLPAAQRWPGGLGFLSKPRAALAGLSRWQSVLLLDADSVLFQPPTAFFKAVSFRQTGLALWRDSHPCFTSLSPYLLQRLHINSTAFCAATRRQESDSSAVVVGGLLGHTVQDSRCAAAAAVALCEHDGGNRDARSRRDLHTRKLMLGDKDSWAIGAALCGMGVESSVHAHPPGAFAVQQPAQHNLGRGSSSPATEKGVTVAVFNGQLQFDDEGQPLYWNGNGQSARELTKALGAASTFQQDGQRTSAEMPEQLDARQWSLQYLRNLPSLRLKPVHASDLYNDEAKSSKTRKLERAGEITITKLSSGKIFPAPPMVMQALTAAAHAATKLSTMDAIRPGRDESNGDVDVAAEDLFQVVTTMMQRGRRLQHAKRAGSALVELDRAASLACAQAKRATSSTSGGRTEDAPAMALCAIATHALAGSLSTHGNSAAAVRAYRTVIDLIEQYKAAAKRTSKTSDNIDSDIELPEESDVMTFLAECLVKLSDRKEGGTPEHLSEALSLIQRVLEINPKSVDGRLLYGTLLLRETATPSTSVSRTTVQSYELLSKQQQAALDEFDAAIALSGTETGSAVRCATAHLKRGHLLESWADKRVGPRIAEAHDSYKVALELYPSEEATAGFKRTSKVAPSAAREAIASALPNANGAKSNTSSPLVSSDGTTLPQPPLCIPGEEEIRSPTTASANASVTCVSCAAGKFDHDCNSRTACVACRPGYDSPSRSTICYAFKSRCESGHMEQLPAAALASVASGMKAASKAKGLFRNHQGLHLGMQAVDGASQLACTACPEGKFDHDRNAATPCAKCRQGMYSPARSVVCVGPSRISSVVHSMAGANQPIDASRLRKPQ